MAEQTALAEMTVSDAQRQMSRPTDQESYRVLMLQAQHAVASGLLPRGIDTPQKAIIIMRKGREMGLEDMYSLSNISVIGGKPVISAQALLRLIYQRFGGGALRVKESSDERCVIIFQRPEWPDRSTVTWTIEDAKRAQLLSSDAWKKYPRVMLQWRAVADAARIGFPDIQGGLYTFEEMGGAVRITDDGDSFIDHEALTAPAPVSPARRSVDTETGEIIEEANGAMFASSNETDSMMMQPQEPMTFSLDDEDSDDVAAGVARTGPVATSKPASSNQLATIEKLAFLLGRDIDMNCDRTSTEASDTITDLSRAYNEMRGNHARGSA